VFLPLALCPHLIVSRALVQVLWTNGGPGCSGLTGFLSEQGPFRAAADGTLTPNKFAWNKIANMVFIEQPAG